MLNYRYICTQYNSSALAQAHSHILHNFPSMAINLPVQVASIFLYLFTDRVLVLSAVCSLLPMIITYDFQICRFQIAYQFEIIAVRRTV